MLRTLMFTLSLFAAGLYANAYANENADLDLVQNSETLSILSVAYSHPKEMSSCGLLRQRAIERMKVIRELEVADILDSNNLLTNKYFLDANVWQDEVVAVLVTATLSEGLAEQLRVYGLPGTFLELNGPGVVWHSYLSQMPEGLSYSFDLERRLVEVRYQVYQNIFCDESQAQPKVIWHRKF